MGRVVGPCGSRVLTLGPSGISSSRNSVVGSTEFSADFSALLQNFSYRFDLAFAELGPISDDGFQ